MCVCGGGGGGDIEQGWLLLQVHADGVDKFLNEVLNLSSQGVSMTCGHY